MNDAQRERRIRALIKERADRVRTGRPTEEIDDQLVAYDPTRLVEIDEELKQLGAEGKPPVKRATRRKAR